MRKQKELVTAPPRHIGLAMIPSLVLQAGLMRRLDLPAGAGLDYWRNELLYRGDNFERHPGPKRALPLRGRDVLMHVLPTTAQHYDMAVSGFEKYLRVGELHGPE